VTADALFNNFIVHFGFMKRLLSDQGAQFGRSIIRELCKFAGVSKLRTTPYNPSCNGITERLNRTLLNMLGTLDPKDKHDWKSQIAYLVHAYNCCRHDSTGFSPYRLMFGREPRLALDIVLGIVSDEPTDHDYGQYVSKIRDNLKKAYELAICNTGTSQQRQKSNHDIRARAAVLEAGDRVLVKVLAVKGRNKIGDRWEEDPFVVIEQLNTDIPVYRVQKENGEGPIRTLHRKHLLPIGALPVIPKAEDVPVPSDRSDRVSQVVPNDTIAAESVISDSSDSEEEFIVTDNQSLVNDADNTEPQVVGTPEPVLIPNEIPDPVAMHDTPVLEDRDLGEMPVPTPRRSLRNKVAPNRYGEWCKLHVANVSRDEANTNITNDSSSHEVLGLLIDKLLDKLISN